MGVVEHDDQRPMSCGLGEQRQQRQPERHHVGAAHALAIVGSFETERAAHQRRLMRWQLGGVGEQWRAELGDPGECHRPFGLGTCGADDAVLVDRVELGQQSIDKGGLADPGHPLDQQRCTAPGPRRVDDLAQFRQFCVPAA